MADWRDVMSARGDADTARSAVGTLGAQIEDGERSGDLACLLAADAICAELRALSTLLDYYYDVARTR